MMLKNIAAAIGSLVKDIPVPMRLIKSVKVGDYIERRDVVVTGIVDTTNPTYNLCTVRKPHFWESR